MSSPTKATSHDSDINDPDLHSFDYLSVVKDENNSSEVKALYFFSLTDREKETLFWALHRNTAENDGKVKSNVQYCDTSSKIDFNSLSYTSLVTIFLLCYFDFCLIY